MVLVTKRASGKQVPGLAGQHGVRMERAACAGYVLPDSLTPCQCGAFRSKDGGLALYYFSHILRTVTLFS